MANASIQVIPAEAVEAAAKAIYHTSGRSRQMPFSAAKAACEAEAREVLEAAAPYITGSAIAYLDESARMASFADPDVTDYERGFDDAIRGMSAKVKRLLNGESQ